MQCRRQPARDGFLIAGSEDPGERKWQLQVQVLLLEKSHGQGKLAGTDYRVVRVRDDSVTKPPMGHVQEMAYQHHAASDSHASLLLMRLNIP